MPTNGAGVYTVPGGINPVVPGTVILDTWANPTLADVAQGITDRLDRSGRGSMLAALGLFDGVVALPGLSWAAEPTSGMWRPSAGITAWSILGTEKLRWHASGLSVQSTLTSASLVVDRLAFASTAPALTTGTVAAFLGNAAAGSPAYLSLVAGNASISGVNLADTDGDSRGYVRYDHVTETLQLGVAGTLRLAFSGTAFNIVGNITPDATGTRDIGTTALEYNNLYVRAIQRDSAGTLAIQADNAAGIITLATAGTTRQTINAAGNFTLAEPDSGNTLVVDQIDGASAIATSQSLSGGLINWQIANNSNTASSDARLRIIAGGAAGGDPYIRWSVTGATDYLLGIDNSATDAFVLSRGTSFGAGDAMSLSGAGNFSFLAPASGNTLAAGQIAGGAAVITSVSLGGSTALWRLENTSNTASSAANLQITVAGASASDPFALFTVSGVQSWSAGVDNSDNDAFKISSGATPGAGQSFIVFPDGRIAGTALHNNAGSVAGTTYQHIASGTWTPTLTNGANVGSSSAVGLGQWDRVGNKVNFTVRVSVTPTAAAGTSTSLFLSLPIASTFALDTNAGGTLVNRTDLSNRPMQVIADTGGNRLTMTFAANSTTGSEWILTGSYLVL